RGHQVAAELRARLLEVVVVLRGRTRPAARRGPPGRWGARAAQLGRQVALPDPPRKTTGDLAVGGLVLVGLAVRGRAVAGVRGGPVRRRLPAAVRAGPGRRRGGGPPAVTGRGQRRERRAGG